MIIKSKPKFKTFLTFLALFIIVAGAGLYLAKENLRHWRLMRVSTQELSLRQKMNHLLKLESFLAEHEDSEMTRSLGEKYKTLAGELTIGAAELKGVVCGEPSEIGMLLSPSAVEMLGIMREIAIIDRDYAHFVNEVEKYLITHNTCIDRFIFLEMAAKYEEDLALFMPNFSHFKELNHIYGEELAADFKLLAALSNGKYKNNHNAQNDMLYFLNRMVKKLKLRLAREAGWKRREIIFLTSDTENYLEKRLANENFFRLGFVRIVADEKSGKKDLEVDFSKFT